MRNLYGLALILAATCIGLPAMAQDTAKPVLVFKEVVEGMPKGDRQEIQVMTASFTPGQSTVFHTHRFPVTVHILEGAFTLELEGQPTVTLTAGQSMVEPPNVRMTGRNRSAVAPIRLLIFYVGDVGTPFLDIAHH